MKKLIYTFIIALSMMSTVFAAPVVDGAGVVVKQQQNENINKLATMASVVNWDKGADSDITVIGFGRSLDSNKLMARRAAIVDAYRNLAETIGGVSVDANTTIDKLYTTADTIKTAISAIIKGAQIVHESATEDGYYVKMSIPMYGNNSVASTIIPDIKSHNIQEITETVTKKSTVLDKETFNKFKSSTYTGIVIDCSGLGLDCTFAPQILDTNGRGIYGIANIDRDFAISHGMVEYNKDINSTNNRAGNNPLIIKANKVNSGTNSKNLVNAIVTPEDADKILLAMQTNKNIVNHCAVVFVR